MADEPKWYYEKLEDGKIRQAPLNDFDGKITGRIVFGVKAWFDENPEERKARGWIKHITKRTKDIEYNRQTQYLIKEVRTIDEYTVEDVYHIANKSEEQMRLGEMNAGWAFDSDDNVVVWGWGDLE